MTEVKERPVPWLQEARREAWGLFERTGLPPRTSETWRRTDFGAWLLDLLAGENAGGGNCSAPPTENSSPRRGDEFPTPSPGGRASVPSEGDLSSHGGGAEVPAAALDEVAGSFIQAGNGSRPAVALDPDLARRGVVLSSLEDAALTHSELVEPALRPLASPDFRKFEAANLARFRGGAFLRIPRGLKVERPFDISFVDDPSGRFQFPRLLVVAEAGGEAAVAESHRPGEAGPARPEGRDYSSPPLQLGGVSSYDRRSSIAFSRLRLGEGAAVRYFYAQSLPPGVSHFWHQRAELAPGARLEHASALLGAGVHKSELEVALEGRGSRSSLRGIVFGSGRQFFDARTAQRHAGQAGWSDLLWRTALKDRARSLYTGLIRVEKEARGCEAFQQNDNRLLSGSARADSTPILEILTDDVRCKHGATVGPLSPEELFYLSSRGLEPAEAAALLVQAFLEPVLGAAPLARLGELLRADIRVRLKP